MLQVRAPLVADEEGIHLQLSPCPCVPRCGTAQLPTSCGMPREKCRKLHACNMSLARKPTFAGEGSWHLVHTNGLVPVLRARQYSGYYWDCWAAVPMSAQLECCNLQSRSTMSADQGRPFDRTKSSPPPEQPRTASPLVCQHATLKSNVHEVPSLVLAAKSAQLVKSIVIGQRVSGLRGGSYAIWVDLGIAPVSAVTGVSHRRTDAGQNSQGALMGTTAID